MEYLRTPEQRFNNLPGYDFAANYLQLDDTEGGELRMHYLDEGSSNANPVLCLHGEPSWSYLYRKMIPLLADAGHRVIAPDLIGFGKSDKPTKRSDYTYQRHVDWIRSVLQQLDLNNITLICQDWGGLIGLRLVAEESQRFARVVIANTMLPTGDQDLGEGFRQWQTLSQEIPVFETGKIVAGSCVTKVSDDVTAAYDAPFPDESYKEGARQFPMLVPSTPDDPASDANRAAWGVLSQFKKPVLTAYSDKDPIFSGGTAEMVQKMIPGCEGQKHTTIVDGGHFLQEDQGEALAAAAIDFIAANPL